MISIRAYSVAEESLPVSYRLDAPEDGLSLLHATMKNTSGQPLSAKLVVEAETDFVPERYLIPGVLYNGNEYGSKNSPKGLCHEDEPWVFAYDRSGIPSCTVSENDSAVFALFGSDRDPVSLRSACSLLKQENGRFLHRIIYPVTEAPVSYSGKNEFSDRYDEWFDLAPGEEVAIVCHLFRGKPEWRNYGFQEVFRRAWSKLKHELPPPLTDDEVRRHSFEFISRMHLIKEGKSWYASALGDATHAIGNHIKKEGLDPALTLADIEKDPPRNFFFPPRESGGIGFTCQGFLCARLEITDAFEKQQEPRFALEVLDNWLQHQLPNGLILKPGQTETDCCHQGWGLIELARIGGLFQQHRLDGSKYLDAARKLAEFFQKKFHPEYGFGKQWSRDGRPLDTTGSVGGFVLLGLVNLWKLDRDDECLELIRNAMELYFTRDLDRFTCNAGAIDCMCVDKESAYPFFEAALELYAATGESVFLERARRAACYLASWLFCYDALYGEEAEFTRIDYHTAGGTLISAEHHAIDPYGVIMVPDFLALAEYTGDPLWKEVADAIRRNSLQAISTPERKVWHGLERPVGAQNEGFFQTRWTKYRTDCNNRGHLNDYLGVWLAAFRLAALFATTGVKKPL